MLVAWGIVASVEITVGIIEIDNVIMDNREPVNNFVYSKFPLGNNE